MYDFAPEENYHLHALKVAKEMGYTPVVLIRQSPGDIEKDPLFDPTTIVINYKNFAQYIFYILKFSVKGAVFYVNSCEWRSLVVPFMARRTIFMGHTHPVRQTPLKQSLFDFILKFFSRVRLNNEDEKNFLLNRGVNSQKLFVVPLAVSLSSYKIIPINKVRRWVVCFGNITVKKNIPTIINAFAIVARDKPDAELHLFGRVLDGLESQLHDLITAKQLQNKIIFHGYVPLSESSAALNNYLVYLNSSFDEGQCVAVYNAALSGCALCLPDIMSFKGVFQDKALFHRATDADKLAKNIMYYLNNPGVAAEHNRLCREMIVNNYNYNKITDGLKKLFDFERAQI